MSYRVIFLISNMLKIESKNFVSKRIGVETEILLTEFLFAIHECF